MEKEDVFKGQMFSPAFDLQRYYADFLKKSVLKGAVEGKVVTRFAPEPSGYLHIGHCKAALLSYHLAKMYKGHMRLRFDDTNPTKEKLEFVESIIDDLKTIGIEWEGAITYESDYIPQLYDSIRKLIEKGLVYADNTPVEQMREERIKKIESACRNTTPEQNVAIFEKMLVGEASEYCLRAKIDMKSNNGCMRDPVVARYSDTPHHRQGTKFKVWPTYDFACPLVDTWDGVTHVMRANEYADRIPQYNWMLKACELPILEIYEYSRLNLEYTVLSKRKLKWFVENGMVEGWNDPRFPTLRGVLRKGIRVETLIEFMLDQGPTKRVNLMEWEKIWAMNKKIIDPICPRYSAVSVNKACHLTVTNGPEVPEAFSVECSKLNKDLGQRPLWRSKNLLVEYDDAKELFVVGVKITLMNWGNVIILTKEEQPDGSFNMTGEFMPEDKDFKTTKKVTWLAEDSNLIIANLIEFDHLIKVKKVEEDMVFDNAINPNSKFVSKAYIDSGLRLLNEDAFLQIERRAYYRIDKVEKKGGDFEYNLFFVPDGKKVGLASIQKATDKEGNIKKEDLADKVEAKKKKQEEANKKSKKNQKDNQEKEAKEEKVQEPKKEAGCACGGSCKCVDCKCENCTCGDCPKKQGKVEEKSK